MIDEKYYAEDSCFHPERTALQAAANSAAMRDEVRRHEAEERYEKGLVNPCECKWEKPDPQAIYDSETLTMQRRHTHGWPRDGMGAETYTAEEMRRKP